MTLPLGPVFYRRLHLNARGLFITVGTGRFFVELSTDAEQRTRGDFVAVRRHADGFFVLFAQEDASDVTARPIGEARA